MLGVIWVIYIYNEVKRIVNSRNNKRRKAQKNTKFQKSYLPFTKKVIKLLFYATKNDNKILYF